MQQKAIIKCKNLLGNTLIRRTFSEIEVKLLHAIRGASRGGICLADSEAQGSAVRQSLLCYGCPAHPLLVEAMKGEMNSDWDLARLND